MSKTTFTLEELREMPKEQAMEVFLKAVKVEGTAVVRRADGSVKYDDPTMEGSYQEAKDGSSSRNGSA